MQRILVSACLLGRPVRYNGTDKASGAADILARWVRDGRVVAVCPEVSAGLPTPRPPAEIQGTGDGADVLAGRARVIERGGGDVTAQFVTGARDAVALARRHGCAHAVLTDGSPSCGSSFIHDGTFTGVRKPGSGATVAALREAGVRVWPEARIAELDALLLAEG